MVIRLLSRRQTLLHQYPTAFEVDADALRIGGRDGVLPEDLAYMMHKPYHRQRDGRIVGVGVVNDALGVLVAPLGGETRALLDVLFALGGALIQSDVLHLTDHHVLDGPELFLLTEWQMFPRMLMVVSIQIIIDLVP